MTLIIFFFVLLARIDQVLLNVMVKQQDQLASHWKQLRKLWIEFHKLKK